MEVVEKLMAKSIAGDSRYTAEESVLLLTYCTTAQMDEGLFCRDAVEKLGSLEIRLDLREISRSTVT